MRTIQNLKLAQPFITGVLVVVVIILLLDKLKCNNDYIPAEPIAPIEQKKSETAKYVEKKFFDSVQVENKQLKREKDSALTIARKISTRLSKAEKTALALATQIEIDRQNKDSTGFIDHCNQLEDLVQEQAGEMGNMQRSYEHSVNIYEQIITNKDQQLSEKDTLIGKQNQSISNLANAEIRVVGLLNKEKKKNGKKWAIGPSFNYGITPDGKTVFTVGASATFILFKF